MAPPSYVVPTSIKSDLRLQEYYLALVTQMPLNRSPLFRRLTSRYEEGGDEDEDNEEHEFDRDLSVVDREALDEVPSPSLHTKLLGTNLGELSSRPDDGLRLPMPSWHLEHREHAHESDLEYAHPGKAHDELAGRTAKGENILATAVSGGEEEGHERERDQLHDDDDDDNEPEVEGSEVHAQWLERRKQETGRRKELEAEREADIARLQARRDERVRIATADAVEALDFDTAAQVHRCRWPVDRACTRSAF